MMQWRNLYGVNLLWITLLFVVSVPETRAADPLPMLLDRHDQLEQLRHARKLMIELRLSDAESRLVALTRGGGEAAAMHHLGVVSLVKGLLTDEERFFEDFFDRSNELKRLLKSQPDSPWRDYLHAENELNRALAHAKLGQTVRAAMAGRSAYGSFEALIRDYPGFTESYKGLGMLKLSIGALSGTYRRILGILGYRGSVEEGLDLLRRAFRESEFGREEAGIYLALLLAQVERSSDEPVDVLATLYGERPESPLISFLYGYMLLHHRQAEEAESVLRPLIRETGDRDIEYAEFYLGQALFVQDKFDDAARHFSRYLENHDGPSLKAQTTVGLALSLEMTGRRDEAVTWYARVDDSRGHETDLAAGREARRRLAHPVEGTERTLLLARNAFDSGRYERALSMLLPLVTDGTVDGAERAEAAYRLGRTYHALGRHDEALAWYAQAAVNGEYVKGRWAPWAHFYRAEILANGGQSDRARQEYQRAASFEHEYDYQNALHSSVRASLEML